jgi:shikimate kinase/3-dehydroquinate synthase
MTHIFLYGPPGSGKSTIGNLLAENLHLPFVDLDKMIEEIAGESIPEIMSQRGESAFRDLESIALMRVERMQESVIALGGGTLLREDNRTFAETNGEIVVLEADFKTILERTKEEVGQRPLITGDLESMLKRLLERRSHHYSSFNLRIATNDKKKEQIYKNIEIALGRFHVRGMGNGYDVRVVNGGLRDFETYLESQSDGNKSAIVADSNVIPLYGIPLKKKIDKTGRQAEIISFPAGEENKTLSTIEYIWSGLLKHGFDRKSQIIALGGGVTGDLAGFSAATYMRGIPWAVLPTTLLAMVDSSLGGKTGVDLPEGKNLVGSFYPPKWVVSDPETLVTLPKEELIAGLGEVVKHGVIDDPQLFDYCDKGIDAIKENIVDIIRRAVAVKVKIITEDPYEKGIRACLNLGHTIGHAVEKASQYRLRHGEAVSIGLVIESRLSEMLGLAKTGLSEEIAVNLMNIGLPTKIPENLSKEAILQAMNYDKKKEKDTIRFALPIEIGKVKTGVEINSLRSILAEV